MTQAKLSTTEVKQLLRENESFRAAFDRLRADTSLNQVPFVDSQGKTQMLRRVGNNITVTFR